MIYPKISYYVKGVCNVKQMFAFEMCSRYFECNASFCKRCEAFCILCAILGFVCSASFGKKRQSFEAEKTCKTYVIQDLKEGPIMQKSLL